MGAAYDNYVSTTFILSATIPTIVLWLSGSLALILAFYYLEEARVENSVRTMYCKLSIIADHFCFMLVVGACGAYESIAFRLPEYSTAHSPEMINAGNHNAIKLWTGLLYAVSNVIYLVTLSKGIFIHGINNFYINVSKMNRPPETAYEWKNLAQNSRTLSHIQAGLLSTLITSMLIALIVISASVISPFIDDIEGTTEGFKIVRSSAQLTAFTVFVTTSMWNVTSLFTSIPMYSA